LDDPNGRAPATLPALASKINPKPGASIMPKDDSDRQALAAAKDGNITTGLNRLNALFTWWGVSNSYRNGDIDTPMKRLQACASDLQKSYGDAYGRQMQALFAANERLAGSLQELVRCRKPRDVIAAELDILATLLEGALVQTKAWVELTKNVQDCCAAMTRNVAMDLKPKDRCEGHRKVASV
jgi:hypothetical protein